MSAVLKVENLNVTLTYRKASKKLVSLHIVLSAV